MFKNRCAAGLVIGLVFFLWVAGTPGTAAAIAPDLVIYDTGEVGLRATDAFVSLSYSAKSPVGAFIGLVTDPATPYMFYLMAEPTQMDAGSLSVMPANFPAGSEFTLSWTYDVGMGQDVGVTFDISDIGGTFTVGNVVWEGDWGIVNDAYPIVGYGAMQTDPIPAGGPFHNPPTVLTGIQGDGTTDLQTLGALIDGSSVGGTNVDWTLHQRDNTTPMPAEFGGMTEAQLLVSDIVEVDVGSPDGDLMVLEIEFDPNEVMNLYPSYQTLGDVETAAQLGEISMLRNADPAGDPAAWQHFVTTFMGDGGYPGGLDLSDPGNFGAWGVDTTDWTVWAVVNDSGTLYAVIPEPGTVMLLLTGLAGLAVAYRRRRNG